MVIVLFIILTILMFRHMIIHVLKEADVRCLLCDMLGRATDLEGSFRRVHRRNLPVLQRNEGTVIHLERREPKVW